MPIILDGTAGVTNNATDLNYTGTLTGGTGVVNLGSGQVFKNASGNVGIGTTTPGARLQVSGVSGVSAALDIAGGITLGTEFSALKFTASPNGFTGSNATAEIRGIATNGGINLGVMAFHTSATEKMRIDSSGNLLVGTTIINPVGNRVNGHQFFANGGYNSRAVASSRDWGISITSGSIVNFYSDNGSAVVYAGSINVNANVTSYTSVSDYRLKENVQPIVGALAKVRQLKPVTFAFKHGGQLSEGFIAHELQAVVPDCVTGAKDAVDAEGKPIYQGIDTSFLVATLTAAIQELKAIVDAQAARITALEAK